MPAVRPLMPPRAAMKRNFEPGLSHGMGAGAGDDSRQGPHQQEKIKHYLRSGGKWIRLLTLEYNNLCQSLGNLSATVMVTKWEQKKKMCEKDTHTHTPTRAHTHQHAHTHVLLCM